MSGFWSAFEDKKSSHKSIRELAQEHASRFEFSTNHDVNSFRDCYGPFIGHEPQYAHPTDYAHMYHPPPGDVEQFCTPLSPCMQSVMENLKLIEQHNARIEMKVLHDNPYSNTSEIPFYGDPHMQPCTEYPYEMRIPTVEESPSIEQLNMILRMNLIRLQNEGREQFQKEMFASSNELHSENSVFSPTHATDIEYEPNLEVIKSTRDTMVLNRTLHSCYDDDDDDDNLILEEHVCTENVVMESSVSETLGSTVVTSTNDVSSDFLIRNIELLDDEDTDTVQLNCEREHDTQLVPDLRNVELSVASSGFLMLEIETLDDHATDLGLVDLFYECEHAATLVDDLGGIDETNNDVPTPLHVSQTETLRPNIELVCNEFVKPTMLRVPNLGLELCASQILLDHFASKYNIFKEPQLECVSLPIPEQVHFELDLVHDAPLTLLDFVPKSASVEKSRFGGSSSFPEASLKFLSCYKCVRLLKSLHVVFWVDPQIFRLYIYGKSSLYIPVGNYVF